MSGNPAKKASGGRTTPRKESNVTSASEWKKEAKNRELALPSGKVCLVKARMGLQTFIARGSIPNNLLSEVMPLLETAAERGRKQEAGDGVSDEELQKMQASILEDPTKLQDMFGFVDAVVVEVVVEPKVNPVPDDEDQRDEELLYVDEVDEEDKMFIFNYVVGGSTDLGRFREGTGAIMAG